jgi:hypothetical protein
MKNELAALINKTTDKILDEWTAIAKIDGTDVDTFIADKLDEMEDTDPMACSALGQRHLQRMMGVAA